MANPKREQEITVLFVDVEEQIKTHLSTFFGPAGVYHAVPYPKEALAKLARSNYDLVIFEINIDDPTWLELVSKIRSISPDTIVITISNNQDVESAIESMRGGVFDYLTKPLDFRQVEIVLERAVQYVNVLKENRRYKEQLEDLLEQRTAEVDRLAYYDTVTQLPNRTLFEERLSQAVAIAKSSGQTLGVLFISLDQFKKVNDTLGHGLGDGLLREFAKRLRSCVDAVDTVARFGSDEFALLQTQINGTNDLVETIGSLTKELGFAFDVRDHEIFATASVGVSLFPHDGTDTQTLLKNAGAALYKAKRAGGANYQFYTSDMHDLASRRLAMETHLRRALQSDELFLYYEPRMSVDSREITGVEALLRWQHPQLGVLPPDEFIPLAEDTGLIVPIGEWVLRNACLQNRRWQDQGLAPMQMAVNISARQFHDRHLLQTVIGILDETGLDPNYLELELTESSVMQNAEIATGVLNRLKAMGVKISIDDFGTGFSSLATLKRLPIDALKIDQSFVTDATIDQDDAALVMAIITLAHNLRLKVIAEGVETEEQLRFLQQLSCDEVQGFLISKPLPPELIVSLLDSRSIALDSALLQNRER